MITLEIQTMGTKYITGHIIALTQQETVCSILGTRPFLITMCKHIPIT